MRFNDQIEKIDPYFTMLIKQNQILMFQPTTMEDKRVTKRVQRQDRISEICVERSKWILTYIINKNNEK